MAIRLYIMAGENTVVPCRNLICAKSDLSDVKLTLPPVSSPMFQIDFLDEEIYPPPDIQNNCAFPLAVGDAFYTSITEACYMTDGDDVKKVICLTVDTKDSNVPFIPGDTIAILPPNLDCEVNELAEQLNIRNKLVKKCIITVKHNIKKKAPLEHIPSVTSLYYVLKSCVDIRAIPKKALLRMLLEYTSDGFENRCLQELCSREGSSLYNSRILVPGATIQDVLFAFPSCQPPIERLLEHLPRLLPRPYSIASSPLISPKSVRIVLSVVEHPLRGLCSGWLHDILKPLLKTTKEVFEKQMKELSLESNINFVQIPMFFRKSSHFNLPNDPSTPLILIGPGTGIAPFIGFLEHRAAQKMMLPDVTFGEIWLFYGCRYSERDFLFRSDIEEFVKKGIISQFFVSFSRETCHRNVRYVQDNIKKHAESFVHKIMNEKGMIYVCGDGKKMAKDVLEAIVQVISSQKGISETDAHNLVLKMQKDGTYKQDIWI